MSVQEKTEQPRVIPVLILALMAMAVLKAANFWFSFSVAGAAQVDAGDSVETNTIALTQMEAPALEVASNSSERRILERLAERRAGLDAREEELDTREKLLQVAELRLDRRLSEMANQREELLALTAQRNRAEQEEFGALSSAYERMKARDAARIFNVLEKDILVPVAAGMRTQALAGVLAEMKPEKARALTRELAGLSRLEAAASLGPQ